MQKRHNMFCVPFFQSTEHVFFLSTGHAELRRRHNAKPRSSKKSRKPSASGGVLRCSSESCGAPPEPMRIEAELSVFSRKKENVFCRKKEGKKGTQNMLCRFCIFEHVLRMF